MFLAAKTVRGNCQLLLGELHESQILTQLSTSTDAGYSFFCPGWLIAAGGTSSYDDATITIEEGVRVFRPLPKTNTMIIDLGQKTILQINVDGHSDVSQ